MKLSSPQLMVFCRFLDIETNRIVEHYLFCQPVGVRAITETIFQKLNEFFKKERLGWSKRKPVITDGTTAIQGSQKGVVKKIKQLSLECVVIHCILRNEALVTNELILNAVAVGGQENELNDVLREVVDIVNLIWKSAKNNDCFQNFVMKWARLPKNLLYIQRCGDCPEGKSSPVCLNFENN